MKKLPLRQMNIMGKNTYLCLSFWILLVGAAVYFLFRNSEILFFEWLPSLGLLNQIYIPLDIGKSGILSFLVYTFPDGLWLLSGIFLIRALWRYSYKRSQIYVTIFCIVAVLFELAQVSSLVPGTFDLQDLLFLGICALVESAIFRIFIMKEENL